MAPRPFSLRSSLSLRPWLTATAVLSLAAGMVFPVASVAAAAPTAHPVAAVAVGGASQKYIAILRNQNTGMTPNSASRLSAVRAQQAPVVARLRAAGGRFVSSTQLLNAVIGTMTASQAATLAADPDVLEVVPDGTIAGPQSLMPPPTAGGTSRALASTPPACGTAASPEIDPEGLANIHATEAQALGFTGSGITVAFLADGVDPTNADFQRNPAYATAGSPAGSPMLTQVDFAGDGAADPDGRRRGIRRRELDRAPRATRPTTSRRS